MAKSGIPFRPVSPQIETLIRELKSEPQAILEVLVKLQAEQGVLTRDMLDDVARTLGLPVSRVYGIATFYSLLHVAEKEPTTPEATIRVCDGPACWLSGGSVAAVRDATADCCSEWTVERSSCLGLCDRAPAALVGDEQAGPISGEVIEAVTRGQYGNAFQYQTPRSGEVRVLLENAWKVDPDSLASALSFGAYQGLQTALQLTPEEVIIEVEKSNLAGRGGAGFQVGKKWRFVASAPNSPKYVICNADESEPLIFKDRVLIDTNPHQILEGMTIAAYATGASSGYIYIRGEYSHQAQRLVAAIEQAEQAGWLGENIRGTGFTFHVHVHRGAGAYICGEETALIESLEGKRGEPRSRPPYPPTAGYHNLPTLVNNVESLASVPHILRRGAAWYKSLSDNQTSGTKLYMVLGHVQTPGLFEAPLGLTLRQIVDEFGGGMRPGSKFHLALCGGAAGTIVDQSLLDVPIDYTSAARGISLGAGAFLICDETVSPEALLNELLRFFAAESCGKCTPCREGTRRSVELLERFTAGSNGRAVVEELAHLVQVMQFNSLCGLGQSVHLPVDSALSHFESDFVPEIRS
jgi:NADH:ubiquinone oxidoreductase subunit F (NADH-binding)/NADH:ubiquinone oxidoreductase subunit E